MPAKLKRKAIELLVNELDDDDDGYEEEDDDEDIGMVPTDEQLAKINQYIPANANPLKKEEVAVFRMVASNNLLTHGNWCWHPDSITRMAEVLVGRVWMTDHGNASGFGLWESVQKHKGRIYEAQHIQMAQCPDELLNAGTSATINRKIVEMFGYHRLDLEVFMPRNCDLAKKVRMGLHLDVSTGTMGDTKMYCPICSDFKSNQLVQFTDDECPHIAPIPWILRNWNRLDPEHQALVAPFMVQGGGSDYGVEVSSVSVGNLPNARIILKKDVALGIY